jgi:hypothetical protein
MADPQPEPDATDCKGCRHWLAWMGGPVRLCEGKDRGCPGKDEHPARREGEGKRKEPRK